VRSACAPIAGGPGQSMPKLTFAPRKLAWAPMACNVLLACTQLPSASQHDSAWTVEIGRWQVNLHCLGLEITFWGRVFRRLLRRETGLAQHMREQSASAVAADRDSVRRSTRWQTRRRCRGRSSRVSLAALAKTDVKTDIAKKLHRHGNYGSRDDNPLLGKIVGERLYERSYRNAYRSADHLFPRPVARHDAGAGHPILRSTDNTKNDNKFHDRKIIQWRTNDCPTAAYFKKLQVTGKRS
jgi:hypothetical protein